MMTFIIVNDHFSLFPILGVEGSGVKLFLPQHFSILLFSQLPFSSFLFLYNNYFFLRPWGPNSISKTDGRGHGRKNPLWIRHCPPPAEVANLLLVCFCTYMYLSYFNFENFRQIYLSM